MKIYRLLTWFSLFLLLGLVACFGGVKQSGKVIGYEPGRVLTKDGFYKVGALSGDWLRILRGNALIAFRNNDLKSTISTDAFCDQAFDDAPLSMLTKHLFAGLQDVKVLKEQSFNLDNRGALRTLFKGSLDGVEVMIDAVVIKKDWCLFDFYLVSPSAKYAEAAPPFTEFFQGFAYTEVH
jgi:hypothetical protein